MTTTPTLKVFLVENHEDTLTYLSKYLQDCGHEVTSARDMTSALEGLTDKQVDVLISDIGLPDGDGWQLMKKIQESFSKPPFGIAMSGFSMRSDCQKSLQAGYKHHLIKPFLPEDLDVLLVEASQEHKK